MDITSDPATDTPEGMWAATQRRWPESVTIVSSVVESTPEGLYAIDRLRQADQDFENELRDRGGEAAVVTKRQIEEEIERLYLFGPDEDTLR